MKLLSKLFGLTKNTIEKTTIKNVVEARQCKEYPIISTSDTKEVADVLRIIKLVRLGRYLASVEDQKLKDMTELLTSTNNGVNDSFRLLVSSGRYDTVYALYQFSDSGDKLKEIILKLGH